MNYCEENCPYLEKVWLGMYADKLSNRYRTCAKYECYVTRAYDSDEEKFERLYRCMDDQQKKEGR